MASTLSTASVVVKAIGVDVASWESQLQAFESVVADAERIDMVFPIAGVGERTFIPNNPSQREFTKPDLTVLDVDLYGVLYTASLAIQQFRKQDLDREGIRGKSQYLLRGAFLTSVTKSRLT